MNDVTQTVGIVSRTTEVIMTIEYNASLRRSTHLESGLAVQWLRDDTPMERRSFFAPLVNGFEIPFERFYSFDGPQLESAEHEIENRRIGSRFRPVSQKVFRVSNISGDFDRQIFLYVWKTFVSQALGSITAGTIHEEFSTALPSEVKEWRAAA